MKLKMKNTETQDNVFAPANESESEKSESKSRSNQSVNESVSRVFRNKITNAESKEKENKGENVLPCDEPNNSSATQKNPENNTNNDKRKSKSKATKSQSTRANGVNGG